MNRQDFYKKSIIKSGLCAILIVSLLPSCGQSEQKQGAQQLSTKQEEKYEKTPKKLKAIEMNIEKIFKALEGPTVNMEEKKEQGGSQNEQSQPQSSQPQQQGTQASNQSQGSQQSQSSQQPQSNQQQGTQQQNPQKQGSTPPKPAVKDPWKEIDAIVSNLHYQWNDYMPEVIKKSTDRKIPESFSTALNKLTDIVKSKDKASTLDAANGLYACIPDLYSLYRTMMSPEIKRMRYLIRSAILASTANNWPQADKDITALKPSWSMFKNTLDKEQAENSDKLDLSIIEFEKVVAEKNTSLTDIKGRIALSNIEAIEKAFQKKEEESAGSQ